MRSTFTHVAYTLSNGTATVQFRGTREACETLALTRLDLYVRHKPLR